MKSKKGITLNTGRTHFKKGSIPWNKGIKSHVKPWLGKKRPNVSGENNYQWKGGKASYPDCIDCGKKLSMRKYKRCIHCRLHSKVDHPRWKGGLTPINQINRSTKEAQEWRWNVFHRDNFECQFCMVRGGKLNAHHIVRFADCKERRTDLANGITLCVECHKSIKTQEPEWSSLFNFILETQNYKIAQYSD